MPSEIIEGFQLSPQQKYLWPWQQNDSSTYRAECVLLLAGELDAERLQTALRLLVNRYEILRTTYRYLPGMDIPLQVVIEDSAPAWHTVDLPELHQQQAEIEELLRQERRRGFDFEHGPLVHAVLLRMAADKHMLQLSLPAVCSDAWTLKSIVSETARFYAAGTHDGEPHDELLQYVRFSAWQNELLESGDGQSEEGLAYWRKNDPSSLPPVTLPFEARPGKEAVFAPETVTCEIEPGVAAKLAGLIEKYDTSVAVVLLACWQTLLWRLSGQAEIAVGYVGDGREYEELRGAMGLFAKRLPIIHCFDESMRFSDVVKAADGRVREAREWQDYFVPKQTTATNSNLPASSNLPVGFEFEETVRIEAAAGVSFTVHHQYVCTDRFKINLSCRRVDGSLTIAIHYDSQLLGRENVKRIAAHLETLIRSAGEKPEALAGELEILSHAERHQLLVEWNQTQGTYPSDRCIHELFEVQVERTPGAPAVVFEDQRLSYGELNAEANRLAHYLRGRGVGPDTAVGLLADRSVEMMVGLLGILKAGGAYVPLNPEHPKARLAHQLADIQARVLLTQEKLLGRAPEFSGDVVCLDRDRTLFQDAPDVNPERVSSPENLVYVIYTSGSTGTPKGVGISHRNLVNYTHFICEKLQLEQAADAAQLQFATVTTISADLGNTCIFPSLVSGGCLHVLSYEAVTDGNLFADYTAEHPIDVLKIVPSHLRALLATSVADQILPRKYLIMGGEALGWDLVKQVTERGGSNIVRRAINHYGPTEATVGSLTFDISEDRIDSELSATIPIGHPIANTTVYIVDNRLQPVPVGVAGELYIGGAGLARGYLNQAELTAERFIPDPFSAENGARLYKTGDLARYLADGSVEFLGRVDNQVKVRGYRIELGEIEATLLRHAGVRETVVVARKDMADEPRLVAYVVPHQKHECTTDDLRRFLQEQLPDYMIPTAFVSLKSLPLTRNGKVDRQALPAPEESSELEKAFVAPRTPTEEALAGIWREVLGVKQVGVNDNFFRLGGHSLLLTRVISRVRAAFDVELPLRSLFEEPTIAKLALTIEDVLMKEVEGLTEDEARHFAG
ncbi:MAG: amino acid adenylation domain-containing protein [Pyrinomonadaceae bacterium]|nr:amino acid adenylation domain-containing protein [Pyrinomonadaceae bacterium]